LESNRTPALRKVLRVPDGIALLVGIMIGVGIYSTPQIIAGYLGSFRVILLLWLIVGAFVYLGGLVYAELGTRMPHTGGEYVYISRCFGPFAGFVFGWAQLFIIRTYPAAGLAIIAVDYLGFFVRFTPLTHRVFALCIIFGLGILNYVGIQRASLFQKISTILKVGGLFALVGVSLVLIGGRENLLSTWAAPVAEGSPLGNVAAALMLIVFAHTGWDRLGYVAGEMKNPRRVIPRSMTLGIGIVVFVYILANMIYYRILGIEGLRESTIVASDVATLLLGPAGAGFVAVLVIVSAMGSINGTMMTAPRVYYAMAKDGLFFRWLGFVHPEFRTPAKAIAAHCIWASVILLVRGTFETIASGMVFAILLFYILTTLCLIKLRMKKTGEESVYKVPGGWPPLIIYLGGIFTLVMFRLVFEWQQSLIDAAFITTGVPFYLIWKRGWKKKRLDRSE